jgi:hypothetical protein
VDWSDAASLFAYPNKDSFLGSDTSVRESYRDKGGFLAVMLWHAKDKEQDSSSFHVSSLGITPNAFIVAKISSTFCGSDFPDVARSLNNKLYVATLDIPLRISRLVPRISTSKDDIFASFGLLVGENVESNCDPSRCRGGGLGNEN